ncbi:hypothetical protein HK102_003408, partial [Quaeritorhiza haematococci]
MFFDKFEPGNVGMVLIEKQRPKKLVDDILQLTTPHRIKWFGDYSETEKGTMYLYKIATLGISRDFGVAEIKVETRFKDMWKVELRNQAFHVFCGEMKRIVLDLWANGGPRKKEGILDRVKAYFRPEPKRELPDLGVFDVTEDALAKASKQSNLTVQTVDKNEDLESERELVDSMIASFPRLNRTLRVTLILREGHTRRVLNEKQLIETLRRLPNTQLGVYRFASIPFPTQVAIINQTDVFIAMHGAALTHVFFMRPDTYLVEMFPYGFRKTIFQNLAGIMKVRYTFWQNARPEDTIFHWEYVEQTRFTDRPKEEIVGKPIDWYNMDSKNFWRNQDTRIEMTELVHTLGNAFRREVDGKNFIYQPWGYFAEQLSSLRIACGISILLNRTLVLPFAGYQPWAPTNDDSHRICRSGRFRWRPIERYLNMGSLASDLPCSWITHDNFYSLNQNTSIGLLRFLPDASIPISIMEPQVPRYYHDIVAAPFDGLLRDSNAFPRFNAQGIRRKYGHVKSRTLAFGPIARTLYDFGLGPVPPTDAKVVSPSMRRQMNNQETLIQKINYRAQDASPRLLRQQTSGSSNSLRFSPQTNTKPDPKAVLDPPYFEIISAISFRQDLIDKARELVSTFLKPSFVAMHVRRGNIQGKCDIMTNRYEPSLFKPPAVIDEMTHVASGAAHPVKECYQSRKYIEYFIRKKLPKPSFVPMLENQELRVIEFDELRQSAVQKVEDGQAATGSNGGKGSAGEAKPSSPSQIYVVTDDMGLPHEAFHGGNGGGGSNAHGGTRQELADLGKEYGWQNSFFLSDMLPTDTLLSAVSAG